MELSKKGNGFREAILEYTMWIKSGKCRRIFLPKACDGQSLIHLSPLIHTISLWSVHFSFNSILMQSMLCIEISKPVWFLGNISLPNTHVGGILSRTLFVRNFTRKAEDLILEGENLGLDMPLEHSLEPSTDFKLIRHLKDVIQFCGGPISEAKYMEAVLCPSYWNRYWISCCFHQYVSRELCWVEVSINFFP